MACRGWLTALRFHERLIVQIATDTTKLAAYLNSLYPAADADGRVQLLDKSWDAMHRVLCDGWLDYTHGDPLLRRCILGGQPLSRSEDWLISYVPPRWVRRMPARLALIDQAWFRERYFALDRTPAGPEAFRYDYELSEQHFEGTWEYFTFAREFYASAARRGLGTVFAADQ